MRWWPPLADNNKNNGNNDNKIKMIITIIMIIIMIIMLVQQHRPRRPRSRWPSLPRPQIRDERLLGLQRREDGCPMSTRRLSPPIYPSSALTVPPSLPPPWRRSSEPPPTRQGARQRRRTGPLLCLPPNYFTHRWTSHSLC